MDRERLFGGNPFGVLVRLAVLSIIVGIVLSALGISPRELVWRLNILLRRIYDLGFGAFEGVLEYFLLGAVVVFPIWIVARLLGFASSKRSDDRRP
jgi:hypothetical protein